MNLHTLSAAILLSSVTEKHFQSRLYAPTRPWENRYVEINMYLTHGTNLSAIYWHNIELCG